jgi:hypothetical protein
MPTVPFRAPGITYNGLHSTVNPTAAQVSADLATTKQHFSHVRTYYPQYGGGAVDVGKLAKEVGLNLMLSLLSVRWPSGLDRGQLPTVRQAGGGTPQHHCHPYRQRRSANDRRHHAIPSESEGGLAASSGRHFTNHCLLANGRPRRAIAAAG